MDVGGEEAEAEVTACAVLCCLNYTARDNPVVLQEVWARRVSR